MKRLINAFKFSMSGFRSAWASEAAFREEVILFFILAPAGLWMGNTGLERAALVGSLFIVLMVELLNTGIETAIDRISEERHALSKKAKDIGSAAVLVSLINVVVTWVLILV